MSSAEGFAELIPVERVAGLWPRAWIAVGAGFSREEIKEIVLERGFALSAKSVTSLPDIATRVVSAALGVELGERVLGAAARQEALRALVGERRISAHLGELKRLKRQAGFFRKLDQAVQASRMAVAHEDEEEVLTERLRERLGAGQYRALRDEIRILCRAYEAWLEGLELWDTPRLLREAASSLAVHGWPEGLSRPEEILFFSIQTIEALEQSFCDELSRHVEVRRLAPSMRPTASSFEWERWHTLDDAADALADRLADGELPLSEQVVLIPDNAAIRRALKRALELRGIPLADARDPNRLRWDEALKWAILPLEVVARDFERAKVVAYLRTWQNQPELPAWIVEISSRGIRQGLASYSGGFLSNAHARLSEIATELGGRKTVEEAGEAHLRLLRATAAALPDREWVVTFMEKLWSELVRDQRLCGRTPRPAPLRHWLERLLLAVAEAQSPIEQLKASEGVQVFRLQQTSLHRFRKAWLLGLSPAWLSVGAGSGSGGSGDYGFNERERELLSAEFGLRSGLSIRRERLAALASWLAPVEKTVILDAHYEWDGRERESLSPLLREVARELENPAFLALVDEERVLELGAHRRRMPSYGAGRKVSPRALELSPAALHPGASGPEMTATALDLYSKCGFQALAYQRWRLNDVREPEAELWPNVKGDILHQAVKHLLASRNEDGIVTLSSSRALELSWKERPPKGLIRAPRVEAYVKSRLLRTLDVFLAKEREFQERAGTTTLALDDGLRFRVDFGDFTVVGTPDRVEECPEGVFVMDYKTSSSLPNGSEMLELGYRLQLPFYAIAAERTLGKPVVGVQFVELTSKGSRSSGMFFPRWNGKEAGRLTNARSNSKSLLALEPEEAWARMEAHILAEGRGYVGGVFKAAPKRGKKECDSCSVADLCGLRRVTEDSDP